MHPRQRETALLQHFTDSQHAYIWVKQTIVFRFNFHLGHKALPTFFLCYEAFDNKVYFSTMNSFTFSKILEILFYFGKILIFFANFKVLALGAEL